MNLVRKILSVVTSGAIPGAASGITIANPAQAMSPSDFIDVHKKMWSEQAGRVIVFKGNIEVEKVSNGYLVTVSNTLGQPARSYIAESLEAVNDIITAQMVCFRLEDKS